MSRTIFGALAGALLMLWAAAAEANPLNQAHYGGLYGDSVYEGGWALYWNPASLARPGFDIAIDTQFLLRQATYDRTAELNNVPDYAKSSNAGLARLSAVGVIPGLALRLGWALGNFDLGTGAGIYVEHAGSATWDKNFKAPSMYPGAVDGPQRWSGISSSFIVVSSALGAGLRHRPTGLSLGATVVVGYANFSTTRARNLDRTDELVDSAGQLKEGRAYFEATDTKAMWTIGARWDFLRHAVGLTWNRGATFDLKGHLAVAFGTQPPSSSSALLKLPLADTVRAAALLRLTDRWILRPSLEYANWSIMKRNVITGTADGAELLVIERDFHDSVAARLRADYRVTRRLTATAGFGYEYGPTPKKTHEPGLAEADSIEGGAAVMFELTRHVRVRGSFTYLYFLPRTITDSIQTPVQNGRYTDNRQIFVVDLEVHGWGAPAYAQ